MSRNATPTFDLALDPQRAALLVIDIQDRLALAMPTEARDRVERNVGILCEAAGRLGVPVVVSEQYPRGLGATTALVARALDALPTPPRRLEKLEFSVCATDGFDGLWQELRRDQWIVTGMEGHVCVYQTVRGLVGRGAHVHVVADAVSSRTDENWKIGLGLAERAGALVTSTEVVVFDLLGRAGSDDFKALSKLLK